MVHRQEEEAEAVEDCQAAGQAEPCPRPGKVEESRQNRLNPVPETAFEESQPCVGDFLV